MDSLDEYLRTSYRPDREFRDGVLIERKGFDEPHSRLQAMLCGYIGERETNWNPIGYISLRVKIREGWYAVPDLCFYPRPEPEGRYPERLPLLWIEILSPEDRMTDVLARAGDLVANGVPYVWIIDPTTLESQLYTTSGVTAVPDKTLRLPGTSIVIPLREVVRE